MSEKLLAYASSQVISVIVLVKENLLLSNIEIRMQFVHIKFQKLKANVTAELLDIL